MWSDKFSAALAKKNDNWIVAEVNGGSTKVIISNTSKPNAGTVTVDIGDFSGGTLQPTQSMCANLSDIAGRNKGSNAGRIVVTALSDNATVEVRYSDV